MSLVDMVNKPPHYNFADLEPIDVIEANRMGFCIGNALKYVARCEYKGTTRQDLDKALWYLKRFASGRMGASYAFYKLPFTYEQVVKRWNVPTNSPKARLIGVIFDVHCDGRATGGHIAMFEQFAAELCSAL